MSGRPLLVVLESPAEGGDVAVRAARLALAAEAGRLAAALGAGARFLTWAAGPDIDFDLLGGVVADIAASAPPVAVLVQDGDAGRQLAPLVARRMGTCAVLGCSDVLVDARTGALTFVKPAYGGWLEQDIVPAEDFVPVVTLDLAGVEPLEAAETAARAEAAVAGAEVIACPSGPVARVCHLETMAPDARSVDLIHARRIVAAGMGTANDRLLAAVHELAELLQGSVGATRPIVDEGRLPKERLIGQTGRTVTPDLYVALGVSGSPHHVAGVRKADRVLSINRDPRAPIFQFSDVGYVADLEAVLPALVAKIKEWRAGPAGGAPAGGEASPATVRAVPPAGDGYE